MNNKYLFNISLSDAEIISSQNLFKTGTILLKYTGTDKHVIIPKSIVAIGENAFASCSDIERCRIPKEVEFISKTAFSGCSKLTIECIEGSYAQEYARLNNVRYVLLPSDVNNNENSLNKTGDKYNTNNIHIAIEEAVDIIENGFLIFKNALYEYRKINRFKNSVMYTVSIEKEFETPNMTTFSVYLSCVFPEIVTILETTTALGKGSVWTQVEKENDKTDFTKAKRVGAISIPNKSWEYFNEEVYKRIKSKHPEWASNYLKDNKLIIHIAQYY